MTKLTAMLLLVAVCSQASRVFLAQREFSIPTGWEKLGRTSADEQLELIFAIKQTNVAELESQLMKVSDPRSPAYGKHLSNEEVHELVKPTAGSLSAVHTFIEGLTSKPLTPNSDLISVTVPMSVAEELLGTEYHSYSHTVSNYVAHRAQSYSLPSNVAAAVDFVSPTVRFLPMNPQPKMKAGNVGVTAQALRTMYGVDSTIGSSPKNKHAATAFLNQHYHPGDLAKFWKTDTASVTSAPNVKEVGGGVKGLLAGVEAMLDIEYINALGANIASEFWGFSGKSPDNPQNGPFLVWLATVSNTSDAEPRELGVSFVRKCI